MCVCVCVGLLLTEGEVPLEIGRRTPVVGIEGLPFVPFPSSHRTASHEGTENWGLRILEWDDMSTLFNFLRQRSHLMTLFLLFFSPSLILQPPMSSVKMCPPGAKSIKIDPKAFSPRQVRPLILHAAKLSLVSRDFA